MSTSNRSALSLVAIGEVALLFIMGVLGNKVAEHLDVTPALLYTITGAGLTVLCLITYLRMRGNNTPSSPTSWKRYLPRTMLGVFPCGVLLGFVCGALVVPIPREPVDIKWAFTLLEAFGFYGAYLGKQEFVGVVMGVTLVALFAISTDGFLAASLELGFCVSFPTALLLLSFNYHQTLPTYFGHVLFGVLLASLLILANPVIRRLKQMMIRHRG